MISSGDKFDVVWTVIAPVTNWARLTPEKTDICTMYLLLYIYDDDFDTLSLINQLVLIYAEV